MGRRAALAIGAMMLATAPVAAARAQTPEPAYQVGQPPPDMPPADGARMAELEVQATAAIAAGDWAVVERLLGEGLTLEQRHYAPDDARIGHSWGWLARAAIEQGRAPQEVIPLAEKRLEIAEKHPEDAATLAAALFLLGERLLAAGQAEAAVPFLTRAETMLEGLGEASKGDLRITRVRRGMALTATGDKATAARLLGDALTELRADPSVDGGERAYVAWEFAVVSYDLDRYAEAEASFRLVFEHRAATGRTRDEAVAGYWLANTLLLLGRTAEADGVMRRVVALETAAAADVRGLTLAQVRKAAIEHGDRMRTAGDLEAAAAAYRLAVQVNRAEPDPGAYLAAAVSRLGLTLQEQARYAEAETAQREALELWHRVRGPGHADVATQYERLGRTLLRQNKSLDAMRAFDEARTIRTALGQETDMGVLRDQAEAAEQSELLQTALQRREEAVQRLRAETPPRRAALAANIVSLAHVHFLLDDYGATERLYREALSLTEEPVLRERIMTGLAMALTSQGRGEEGEPLQRQVLAEVTARAGPVSVDSAIAMSDLARILAVRGDPARAEPLLHDALAVFEAQPEPDRSRIATLKLNLGVALGDMDRHLEALQLFNEAFRIRREVFGAGHARTVKVIELIVFEYVALGAYDQAEPLAAQLVRLTQDRVGADHPILAKALQRHAYVLQSAGRYAEAERLMRRAADIMRRQSQDPRDRIRYDANWGVTLLDSDRPREALEVFRRAEAGLVERRRTATDPSWSRNEAESFRFLHRFAVQAAWRAATASSP